MRIAALILASVLLVTGCSQAEPEATSASASVSADAGGCQMGRGRGALGTSGRAILVLAAFVGLLLRRQYKKGKDAAMMAELGDGAKEHDVAEASDDDVVAVAVAARTSPKLKKLRLGRGGIVNHK